MKLNLAVTAAQVPQARGPIIGEDVEVYFAPEDSLNLGRLRALTATTAEFSSAGGLGIPAGGRDVYLRVDSANMTGVGGAMVITFNVTLDDDVADTAVATFHIPTWAPSQANKFPYGIAADLIPATVGNVNKKIKTLGSVVSVANMTPGNTFEVFTSPNLADFTFIDCCRGKGGAFNLPEIIEIACGRKMSAYTKLGRSQSNKLKIEFINRGALEQLARFNGHLGTIRFDIVKDDAVLAQRQMYAGFIVRANGEFGDVGETMITAESPYTSFAIGYMRVV